jgi:hypothetical protein
MAYCIYEACRARYVYVWTMLYSTQCNVYNMYHRLDGNDTTSTLTLRSISIAVAQCLSDPSSLRFEFLDEEFNKC